MIKQYIFNGNPTDYYVDEEGNVYSYKRNKKILMHQTNNKNGYKKVRISVNGKVYNRNVHRMIAETFIPNTNNLPEVNHIDGNKENNNINNLEWVSRKGNAIHAYKNGLFGVGEDFSKSSITNNQCHKICEYLENTNKSMKTIANLVCTTKKVVSDIYYGKTWTYISKNYDFTHRKKQNKLDEKTVNKICVLLEKGMKSKEISEKLNVKIHCVKDIKRHKSWVSVSNKYKF